MIFTSQNIFKEYIIHDRYQTKTSQNTGEHKVGDCLYVVYGLFKRISNYNSSNFYQNNDNGPNWRGQSVQFMVFSN